MNSKICALLLVIALGPVPIKADEFFPGTEPIDAAVRLESIKASLLDYALDHSVYVSTQAWLDGNGAVEEKVLLLSGLNLERVRVNEYRNAFGVAEAAIIAAPTTGTESWYGCPVTSPVKRRVALISHVEQTGSVAARNIAVAAQSHVMQHLTAHIICGPRRILLSRSALRVRFMRVICNSRRQRPLILLCGSILQCNSAPRARCWPQAYAAQVTR